jgi:hypothetical protein
MHLVALIPHSLKHHINLIISLFVDEMHILGTEGVPIYDCVTRSTRQLKAFLLRVVCDLVQRKSVSNITL